MTIGEKIKDLRKKNNLTQEKLADYLCISYQAVSKWETGISSPDLSLIIPLTKLLHVTADELLSPSESEPDMRHNELKAAYDETYKTNDLQKRYEICETAVAEYPGDMKFLSNFAWVTSNRSFSFEDQETYIAEQEKAIKLFASVIKNCGDEFLRGNAIEGITQLLSWRGRHDEAKKYAALLPERTGMSRDSVWENCIDGDELIKYKQQKVMDIFGRLLTELSLIWPADSHDKIEILVKIMFEDGRYLEFNFYLYQNSQRHINRIMQSGNNQDNDRVMKLLEQMRVYAYDYDSIAHVKQGVYRYTSELFDRLETNTAEWFGSKDTGLTEDYIKYLSDPKFDILRDREDFKLLMKK